MSANKINIMSSSSPRYEMSRMVNKSSARHNALDGNTLRKYSNTKHDSLISLNQSRCTVLHLLMLKSSFQLTGMATHKKD